jgi:hypothetical protein
LLQVWSGWVTRYKERLLDAWKMGEASRHFAVRQKQLVLGAWQEYIACRRRKLHQNRVALGCHRSTLLLKCYTTWRARMLRNREVAEFEDLIVLKSRLSICRRAMGHWKYCILAVQEVVVRWLLRWGDLIQSLVY